MPIHTSDALILRTYALGESDRLVVFLTCDHGKKRGVAKNARQSRRRFGGALEPMTAGRVRYREREGRDLVLLEDVAIARSPLSAADADALGYVSYFAELIDECAPDNDPNAALYRLGEAVVEALASGIAVDPVARYFEYWLLRLQGVYQPGPGQSPEAERFLAAARTSNPRALADVPAGSRMLRELEQEHRRQIAAHLDKDLKSARVLRDIRRR